MRSLHQVEAPDRIWYVENDIENPNTGDQARLNVIGDSVFVHGSQEVEIAQEGKTGSVGKKSQASSQSSKSLTSASSSILARRGDVATLEEIEK